MRDNLGLLFVLLFLIFGAVLVYDDVSNLEGSGTILISRRLRAPLPRIDKHVDGVQELVEMEASREGVPEEFRLLLTHTTAISRSRVCAALSGRSGPNLKR